MESINNVLSLDNFAEYDMLVVKPGARHEGDEKLGSVGSGSSVGHGEEVGNGMFFLEVLVLEFVAVDGFSSSAVVGGEVSSLSHEVVDDTVESTSLVSESLLPGAESSEVLSSLGDDVVVELEGDSASS